MDKEYSDNFKSKMKLALTKRYEEIGLEVTDDALLNQLMDMVLYPDAKTLQEFKVTVDDVKKSFDLNKDKDFNFRNKSKIGVVYNELQEEPENEKKKEKFFILLNEAIFELNISLLESNDELHENTFLNMKELSELKEELDNLIQDKNNYDSEYFEEIETALKDKIDELNSSNNNIRSIQDSNNLILNSIKTSLVQLKKLYKKNKGFKKDVPKYKHR